MAAVTVTARKVSAMPTSTVFPYDAGGSGSLGDSVYINGSGAAVQSDGNAGSGAELSVGIVVSAGTFGATTFVSGDRVGVCRYGPVEGFSGATPGGLGYASDTAGVVADAAGTNSRVIGRFDSATCLFVNPPA